MANEVSENYVIEGGGKEKIRGDNPVQKCEIVYPGGPWKWYPDRRNVPTQEIYGSTPPPTPPAPSGIWVYVSTFKPSSLSTDCHCKLLSSSSW